MDKYFVVSDEYHPGAEFLSYEEAREYLNEMRGKYPNEWKNGIILGPGLNNTSDSEYDYPPL